MAKKQSLTPEEQAAKELADQERAKAISNAERQDDALKFAWAKRLASTALEEMDSVDRAATAQFLMPLLLDLIEQEIDVEDPESELLDSLKKTWEAIAQRLGSKQYLDLDQYLKFDRSLVRSRDKF